MKAYERNFSFISSLGKIKIPFFQRKYIWGEHHWLKLWNDLTDAYKNEYSHFLGSIILKTDTVNNCLLVDGQQRTTTFTILLYVLGKKSGVIEKHQILRTCLFGQDAEFEYIPRIEHSNFDRDVFQNIILEKEVENKNSQIYKCYDFFLARVEEFKDEYGEKKLIELLNKILTDKLFVIVEIDKDEDEQRIFDSINTSGQPLANFDIVKNELFSHFNDDEKSKKIYNKYWVPVFEKNNETIEFWDEYILSGRENKVKSDIFLHNFAIIENIFDPSKETISRMNEVYKNHIRNIKIADIENFIKQFTEYAKVFYNLPFFNEIEEYEYNSKMKRFLHIVHTLQLSTFIPLTLFLELSKVKGAISEKDYEKSLDLLEKYIVKRSILGFDTSGYNKIVHLLITELSKSKDIYSTLESTIKNFKMDTDRLPSKDDIKQKSFNNFFDVRLAKVLLFWIELYKRDENKEFIATNISLQYNFQLEHIMPKAWDKYWVLSILNKTFFDFEKELLKSGAISKKIDNIYDLDVVKGFNNAGYDVNEVIEDIKKRNEKINEFGNYTLLKGKLNNSIKNYEWTRKRDGEGNKKGVKYFCDLFLNKDLCQNTEWNENTITKRSEELKNIVLTIWG